MRSRFLASRLLGPKVETGHSRAACSVRRRCSIERRMAASPLAERAPAIRNTRHPIVGQPVHHPIVGQPVHPQSPAEHRPAERSPHRAGACPQPHSAADCADRHPCIKTLIKTLHPRKIWIVLRRQTLRTARPFRSTSCATKSRPQRRRARSVRIRGCLSRMTAPAQPAAGAPRNRSYPTLHQPASPPRQRSDRWNCQHR